MQAAATAGQEASIVTDYIIKVIFYSLQFLYYEIGK